MHLAELPRAPSGKLDRAGLPVPDVATTSGYTAPDTPAQRAIGGVWGELLGVVRVGLDDDFFDLGGHSLLAVQVVARLRRHLPDHGQQVGLVDLFRCRTVWQLAGYVEAAASEGRRPMLCLLTPPPTSARPTQVSYVCVPYGSGSAVVYQPLADALPAGHALYVVSMPGHDVGVDESPEPPDDLVKRCAEEILRTVRTARPLRALRCRRGHDGRPGAPSDSRRPTVAGRLLRSAGRLAAYPADEVGISGELFYRIGYSDRTQHHLLRHPP